MALLFGKPLKMFDGLGHLCAQGHRKVLRRVKLLPILPSMKASMAFLRSFILILPPPHRSLHMPATQSALNRKSCLPDPHRGSTALRIKLSRLLYQP